jgi:hypothetical protein
MDGACDHIYQFWGAVTSANIAAAVTWEKGRDFAKTQTKSILAQLWGGIRYVDLRVVYSVDAFYIHHGLLGPPLKTVLSDVRYFMTQNAGEKEVVILQFSHFSEDVAGYQLKIEDASAFQKEWVNQHLNAFFGKRWCRTKAEIEKNTNQLYNDMSREHHAQLMSLIESDLGKFLYHRKPEANFGRALYDIPLGDIVQDGPKVVVLYNKEGDYAYPDFLWQTNGVNFNAPRGNYANSDNLHHAPPEPPKEKPRAGLWEFAASYIEDYVKSGDQRLLELPWMLTAQAAVVAQSTTCYTYKTYPYLLHSCEKKDEAPYNSIHTISQIANAELDNFIYDEDNNNKNPRSANIILVDFFEEYGSPAVNIALDAPVAVCANVTVPADAACKAAASVDGGSSDNDGQITLAQDPPGPYKLGNRAVSLTVSDGILHSSCSAVVSVIDTTPPGMILAPTPTELPPTGTMAPITIRVIAADNCDPKPKCRIDNVQSSEPAGRKPDWRITGDLGLQLRAKLSDPPKQRVYDVTVACTDRSGNTGKGSFQVIVTPS